MALLRHILILDGTREEAYIYPVFLRSGSVVELTSLVICASGKLFCDGDACTLDDVRRMIETHCLKTRLSEGERLLIRDLITFRVTDVLPIVQEHDLLGEVHDLISELNGTPTTSDLCRAAYEDYLSTRSEADRSCLKAAYERVPSHLRCWLLGFDAKDVAIRKAIDSSFLPSPSCPLASGGQIQSTQVVRGAPETQ